MKHTSFAALLAAPLLLAWATPASANPPTPCFFGMGGGGMCLNMFSKLHQHGPLFNYGPYYGYPPFEPYGPWNSYLQYNPWYYGDPYADAGRGGLFGHGVLGNGCGKWGCHGRLAAIRGLLSGRGDDCGSGCGWHANWRSGGWFRGDNCVGCARGSWFSGWGKHSNCGHGDCGQVEVGCSSCQASVLESVNDPLVRYSGIGNPADSAAFYTALPTIDRSVIPAGK